MKNKERQIWWKHGVIYHIYVRSFNDSNGDGIGDLLGIIEKLDYLSDLGVSALWLSPIYKSPNMDYGYDVEDYKSINPEYGTMDDFRLLLKEAHTRGIKIIMDMILNHTSNKHKWFLDAKDSKYSSKRDWYLWFNSMPNNWKTAFGRTAWTFESKSRQYYYHSFFKEQPDLNWRNEELRKAFFNELRFWLELGVDGFRLDVINMIIKDKKLRNNPSLLSNFLFSQKSYTRNRQSSIEIIKSLRILLDEYTDKMSVGEIYTLPPGDSEMSARYLSSGNDALHMAFDFSLIFKKWCAKEYYNCIEKWLSLIPTKGWPCNVLSNHDLKRSINRKRSKKNRIEKAKLDACLLLTLKGTPFVYYGEELGMLNTNVPYKKIKDRIGRTFWPIYKGRDQSRTPMQWSSETNAGFSSSEPWLPINKDYITNNIKDKSKEKESLINFYKKLIDIRNNTPALSQGDWKPLIKGVDKIIVYSRNYEKQSIIVILNFSDDNRSISTDLNCEGEILISSKRENNKHIRLDKLNTLAYEATVIEIKH